MPRTPLPTHEQAYVSLCAQGLQFPEGQAATLLEGLTFTHAEKGEVGVTIDARALRAQGWIYADDPALREALWHQGVETSSYEDAAQVLRRSLKDDYEWVWGFSGFATGGINPETGKPFNYTVEAAAMSAIYDQLIRKERVPGLVIDGGVSAGSLGLNGVIAGLRGIPSLGFIPRQGLASVGIRDHLVVWGDTYEDREQLVGGTPDALVCVGGAKGTRRECIHALEQGSAVLLLALRDDYPEWSLPNTYHEFDKIKWGLEMGRFVVCNSIDDIPKSVDNMLKIDTEIGRAHRLATTETLLRAA